MRVLLDLFIRWFGGVTPSTWGELLAEAQLQRAALRNEIDYLRAQLEIARADRENLQSIIFERFGVIVPSSQLAQSPSLKPVPTSGESWPRMKRRLEHEDAKRQIDAVEQSWRAKGATRPGESSDREGESGLGGLSENVS